MSHTQSSPAANTFRILSLVGSANALNSVSSFATVGAVAGLIAYMWSYAYTYSDISPGLSSIATNRGNTWAGGNGTDSRVSGVIPDTFGRRLLLGVPH